jgi:hypothetical protein
MLCALLVTGIPQSGMADVIMVYSDCTGASCSLAPGFTSTAAVMHRFATGAVASRFKISLPPGSSFFSFATSFVPVGNVETGIQGYGQCLSGSFCIGNLVAILAPGAICIYPAVGPMVTYTDCSLVEYPRLRHGRTLVGNAVGTGHRRVPRSRWKAPHGGRSRHCTVSVPAAAPDPFPRGGAVIPARN